MKYFSKRAVRVAWACFLCLVMLCCALPRVQAAILENVSRYVCPGGTLLYSTCTVLKRENEDIVNAFLAAHPEFHPECFDAPEGAGFGNVPMATLLPQKHGTDGFFICRLRRDA